MLHGQILHFFDPKLAQVGSAGGGPRPRLSPGAYRGTGPTGGAQCGEASPGAGAWEEQLVLGFFLTSGLRVFRCLVA